MSASAAGAALAMQRPAWAQVAASGQPAAKRNILLDFDRAPTAFPHYWETVAGSDRVAVGLREQWRQDLIRVHRDAGIKSIRSHGLFDDEMGIATRGSSNLNFNYLDQVYDFMLDNGVRPFVELSFMPEALARSTNRMFFYRGNISPPKKWSEWRDLVQAFAQHCVQRYGASEVSSWKFEVWNEPNAVFWAGSQDEYFKLYRQSASALKEVDRRLQVGGPASAGLDWIPDLISYTSTHNVPLDFISAHLYPDGSQQQLFGQDGKYPFEQVIPRGIEQGKSRIASTSRPDLPLYITEWSTQNPAFIAETIKSCTGLTDVLSYWTFSNVFEEGGPLGMFNNLFGMFDQRGIARPSFQAFALLHRLGMQRIVASDGPVLATRKPDGSTAVLVWNLIPAKDARAVATGNPFLANADPFSARAGWVTYEGSDLNLKLRLKGWKGRRSGRVTRADEKHGSAFSAWTAMGNPTYPNERQIETLRRSGELPAPIPIAIGSGHGPDLDLTIPPNGLALIEIDA